MHTVTRQNLNCNNLPAHTIAELAVRAIELAGGINDDWNFIVERAGRGWPAGAIARAYVRRHFPKGDIHRRRLLVGLTKLGARAA